MKTPGSLSRRTRHAASNDLLAAASSPTFAATRCAESLKRAFSGKSSSANISVYVRVRKYTSDEEALANNSAIATAAAAAGSTTSRKRTRSENAENKRPSDDVVVSATTTTTTISNSTAVGDEVEPEEPSFNVESESTLVHRISGQQGKRFLMDKIFEESSTQEEVFERVGRTQVDKALSGFHGSIFAYGQTGTGKTHTMLGPDGGRGDLSNPETSRDVGLIPRVLHYLFEKVRDETDDTNKVNKITVSYLEIYKETIRDLLNPGVEEKGSNLQIKEHKRDGPFVKNLSERVVTSPDEALALMALGNETRSQAKTKVRTAGVGGTFSLPFIVHSCLRFVIVRCCCCHGVTTDNF